MPGTLQFGAGARVIPAGCSGNGMPLTPISATSPWANWRVWTALAALPMFAQCFQYMVDVPPLYFLSKVWPFLMLPLFLWGFTRLHMPFKILQTITLVWVIGVTPLVGIIQLGNDFVAALATTIKVWPFTFSFALAGMLVLLQLPADSLRRVILTLGAVTYAIMLALWLIVPASVYGGGDAATKLFMYDPERGYHLYIPMFFGMLLVFYLNRSFWIQPRIWKLLAIVACFTLQFMIYKERAAIGGGAVAVIVGGTLSAGRWRPLALAILALGGGIAALYAISWFQSTADVRSLGGSLAVRQVSVATAWTYVTADPWRWLVGVGATTRYGNVTLAQLFGNRMFFLSDIGWLGVLFEYGAIGVSLVFLVHLAALRMASRCSRRDDALSQAFVDYVVYLIIVSSVYSVVFIPGELMVIMALSYYLAYASRAAPTYGSVVAQPRRPMPRQIELASPRPLGRVSLRAPSGSASNG
jgi:hypothetical protein